VIAWSYTGRKQSINFYRLLILYYREEKKIMSKVTEFYEAFSKDEAMQERANILKGSGAGGGGEIAAEAIVAFAKEEGYSFTAEELKDFINSKELSDDDLKAVAGGGGFYQPSGRTCCGDIH
jgi:hypothetical protein